METTRRLIGEPPSIERMQRCGGHSGTILWRNDLGINISIIIEINIIASAFL